VTVADATGGAARTADTDANGRWVVSSLGSRSLRITVESPGFRAYMLNIEYDSAHPGWIPTTLQVGSTSETVEVTASDVSLTRMNAGLSTGLNTGPIAPPKQAPQAAPASPNVVNLQKRVAGVLPIAIDVPRAGTSFRFVRPLVVDEETKVTFSYRTK
jgi:hypothetical protein